MGALGTAHRLRLRPRPPALWFCRRNLGTLRGQGTPPEHPSDGKPTSIVPPTNEDRSKKYPPDHRNSPLAPRPGPPRPSRARRTSGFCLTPRGGALGESLTSPRAPDAARKRSELGGTSPAVRAGVHLGAVSTTSVSVPPGSEPASPRVRGRVAPARCPGAFDSAEGPRGAPAGPGRGRRPPGLSSEGEHRRERTKCGNVDRGVEG